MLDNQYDRVTSNHRSGKLGNKMYKVAIGSDRVFDRKEERKNKQYWVLIMVDESGSMSSGIDYRRHSPRKIDIAAQSISAISEALSKHNINFCIIGFNEFIRIHKTFEDKFSKLDYINMNDQILKSLRYGGQCNHDLIAVLQGQEIIKGLPRDNTIGMLFLDGLPACGCSMYGSHKSGKLNLVDEAIALSKQCKLITFGIGNAKIESYYPNVVNIASLDNFMERSIIAIQAIIQKG